MGGGPGGGASAEGKARYRARQKGEGIYGLIRRIKIKRWSQVEPVAVHQCDFAAHITDVRVTSQRTIVASLVLPIEYGTELIALHLETEHAFGFFRAYTVERGELIPDYVDDTLYGDDSGGNDSD